jgi:hypothetical protein
LGEKRDCGNLRAAGEETLGGIAVNGKPWQGAVTVETLNKVCGSLSMIYPGMCALENAFAALQIASERLSLALGEEYRSGMHRDYRRKTRRRNRRRR